ASPASSIWCQSTCSDRAASRSFGYRSSASRVAKTSRTQAPPGPSYASASRTACGPSARKRRADMREARRASFRAAFTRVERGVSGSGPVTTRLSIRIQTLGSDLGDQNECPGSDRGLLALSSTLGGHVRLGDLDERREGSGVVDGEVGEDLAVD